MNSVKSMTGPRAQTADSAVSGCLITVLVAGHCLLGLAVVLQQRSIRNNQSRERSMGVCNPIHHRSNTSRSGLGEERDVFKLRLNVNTQQAYLPSQITLTMGGVAN